MKISRDALQTYFSAPLPSTAEIADSFTFHCFEIEEVAGDVLDIKVLPNRAPDCSSESGIARELSAILDVPLREETALTYSDTVVSVSLAGINNILGSNFSEEDIENVFRRLSFRYEKVGELYSVSAPLPRTDIGIPEDVAEEVVRILGFEKLSATELPPLAEVPDQARYRGIERMKDQLVEEGFIEISTQSFAKQGAVQLANPFDKTKPWLRLSLEENLREALERAKQYALVLLPPKTAVKLFEIGTVFPKEGEYVELRMTERVPAWGEGATTVDNLSVAKLEDYGKDYLPKRYTLGQYKPFSLYPCITRDIALWVPSETQDAQVEKLLRENAGDFLVRLDQFDRFEKEGKTSLAFRLVFQSAEKTLTDTEISEDMARVTSAVSEAGFTVR